LYTSRAAERKNRSIEAVMRYLLAKNLGITALVILHEICLSGLLKSIQASGLRMLIEL
jgi:hypothetical protein